MSGMPQISVLVKFLIVEYVMVIPMPVLQPSAAPGDVTMRVVEYDNKRWQVGALIRLSVFWIACQTSRLPPPLSSPTMQCSSVLPVGQN